ncbi:hypothetical protein BVER_04984c [Candidatus Burkholderia verschuerenii]|uniref:Uncharacterized protein n=1 Tax=Candidatus Burkholderia verschuerenii TaxID=242163 RepID=A0A0L0ME80_9BURK|nr:DUF6013 family protein [Candidatus Burkholderia verschuerenii]KND60289.1 hypothetical protein BVER_04984c [Candidatus Burkholderia verschuerenii]
MNRRSNVYRLVPAAALALCAFATVHATPGIKVLSEAPNDGPIKYTVKMESKNFGNEQETRTIRSGQTDDFTWQGSAPSGAQAVADACSDSASVPKSADGAAVRQVQIRFAPVIGDNGAANVQISFRAYAPKGVNKVTVNGKSLQCPTDNRFSQIVRFTMATATGSKKTVTLDDGTQLTVTASRK